LIGLSGQAGNVVTILHADLIPQAPLSTDAWLNPPGASEAELKKRTLTNLYNQLPTWLDNAHRRLDEAVFAASGSQCFPIDNLPLPVIFLK